MEPATVQSFSIPQLPNLPPAPTGEPPAADDVSRRAVDWLRGALVYFQARAQRSEIVQALAANVADAERQARQEDEEKIEKCRSDLAARDEAQRE